MEPFVDGAVEADAIAQEVQCADAAIGDAATTLGEFVMDVGGGEDGLVEILEFVLVEPILNSALAGVQLASYLNVHSKLLFQQRQKELLHL
jgi:purine-nucleoside phosphorylase